jgi:pimeloyl-ACP methyl ester carboxylesterase
MNPRNSAWSTPSLRRAARFAAGILTILALAALSVSSSTAQPSHKNGGKADATPTVVLVHGAWADGSSWRRVTRRLQRDRYTVDVPPNPLRGLASDAEYLADYLQTISGPIVLVGHSYGGAVITNAAVGNPNVKALIYVNAFIPDRGQSTLDLVQALPGSHLGGDPSTVFNFVPYPGASAGDADVYVKPSVVRDALAADLSPAAAQVLAATQRPVTFSALTERSGAPAWKTIPSWAVIGTADNAIPPAEQLVMAKHASARITQIDAPHLSMLIQPEAITKVIERAARTVG